MIGGETPRRGDKNWCPRRAGGGTGIAGPALSGGCCLGYDGGRVMKAMP